MKLNAGSLKKRNKNDKPLAKQEKKSIKLTTSRKIGKNKNGRKHK